MIMAGPDIDPSVCETPVSLLDISATIPSFFGIEPLSEMVGADLRTMANEPANRERVIFCEYHAAGATGAYMLRKGQYKLIYYVNFDPRAI